MKPINEPELRKKTRKRIVVAPDFKKQCGRPMKNRHKEHGEYEEQEMMNKTLRRSGLVIKCGKCGREGQNKKSGHKQPNTTPTASSHCNTTASSHPSPSTSTPIDINSSATSQDFKPTPTTTPQSSTQAGGRSKLSVRRSHNSLYI